MAEIVQVNNDISNNETPRPDSAPSKARARPPPISAPPLQSQSPSQWPLLKSIDQIEPAGKTSRSSTPRIFTPRLLTPRFITPLASPIKKALQLTRLDPHDAWLPITESRNGNAYYAAFHTLCSGIGFQALVLPVAFPILGWPGGIIALTLTFIWQLYTLYILVQLHENVETGVRYSRYMQLCNATFGEKLSYWIVLPPVLQLSAGTCLALIMVGGSSMKMFYQTVCGKTCTSEPLTTVEWYLVFTCAAVILSQLPNLNSIAGISLIGAICAVGYCTIIWVVSVAKGRLPGISYSPVQSSSNDLVRTLDVLNALGIFAFAFRGHNLTLEIQATMPSSEKQSSTVPMWRGVKFAYLLVAMCLFPMAIGGYWAYGQKIPDGGMLTALQVFHGQDVSQFILGLTSMLVIINSVSSFQIYGMPTFDNTESQYVKKKKKPCPWWLRSLFRVFFGFFLFFFAVAAPFAANLSGLVGGASLPITLVYPCFMWLKIKKPKAYSPIWCLNWGLGIIGILLSVLFTVSGVFALIKKGLKVSFFKPQ